MQLAPITLDGTTVRVKMVLKEMEPGVMVS